MAVASLSRRVASRAQQIPPPTKAKGQMNPTRLRLRAMFKMLRRFRKRQMVRLRLRLTSQRSLSQSRSIPVSHARSLP